MELGCLQSGVLAGFASNALKCVSCDMIRLEIQLKPGNFVLLNAG